MVTMNGIKRTFPNMSESVWWVLRERFSQTVPSIVNARYLMPILNMTQESAEHQVAKLKALGLIDDIGKPTDRANKWRNDRFYPDVCQELLSEIYPTELLEAFPSKDPDGKEVKAWFSHDAKVGDNAASKMAGLFLLLKRADLAGKKSGRGSKNPTTAREKPTPSKTNMSQKMPTENIKPHASINENHQEQQVSEKKRFSPSIHIDIQVHIPTQATPEQIDQIFSSMRKHLYEGE